VFTARYALSPYIKQIRFVFKGLKWFLFWLGIRGVPAKQKNAMNRIIQSTDPENLVLLQYPFKNLLNAVPYFSRQNHCQRILAQ
jgi:hypothetical protein